MISTYTGRVRGSELNTSAIWLTENAHLALVLPLSVTFLAFQFPLALLLTPLLRLALAFDLQLCELHLVLALPLSLHMLEPLPFKVMLVPELPFVLFASQRALLF